MNVSIFYENSYGMMCQWRGQIISQDTNSISIRFSKNKAYRYNLKDSGFCLVTKKAVKDLGVSVDKAAISVSFDEKLRDHILKQIDSNNIAYLWQNDKWEITKQ